MCELCEKNLEKVTQLATNIEALYRAQIANQTRKIPKFLRNMGQEQQTGLGVTVNYQSQILTRVVLMNIVTTSPGNLQIGQHMTIPIPNTGLTPIPFAQGDSGGLLLDNGIQITLTQNAPGYCAVWCYGDLLPDQGAHY